MQEPIEILAEAFSLSEKEVFVLQKLLELGTQPASALAKVCELPRNTVRGVLDNLVKYGLLIRSQKAKTQFYAVESKESLIRVLESKKENTISELETQINLVHRSGDLLNKQTKHLNRPKITFYDGYAGLKKVYEDTLNAKSGLRAWASFEANKEALPSYFPNYYQRRTKRKISMRSIHPDTPLAREGTTNNKKFLRRSVLIPQREFTIIKSTSFLGETKWASS